MFKTQCYSRSVFSIVGLCSAVCWTWYSCWYSLCPLWWFECTGYWPRELWVHPVYFFVFLNSFRMQNRVNFTLKGWAVEDINSLTGKHWGPYQFRWFHATLQKPVCYLGVTLEVSKWMSSGRDCWAVIILHFGSIKAGCLPVSYSCVCVWNLWLQMDVIAGQQFVVLVSVLDCCWLWGILLFLELLIDFGLACTAVLTFWQNSSVLTEWAAWILI